MHNIDRHRPFFTNVGHAMEQKVFFPFIGHSEKKQTDSNKECAYMKIHVHSADEVFRNDE